MISTATKIKFKRSGVAGKVPTLADLSLGELGINYSDGKIFLRQENSIVGSRIIEPGQTYEVGKTIFVTTEGNDNNTGQNAQDAVRSIKRAAELALEGDTIKVFPGQYIEDNPIVFRDRVSVEGTELRNVLVTPGNPEKDLYLVGEAFHATNHAFVSNNDSKDGAAIISFRPLEGTASDRYFDAARLIRDNLAFLAGESVGFLTSGYSGFAAGQRSQDGARALELNTSFISEEAFQFINSPDYKGPNYFNPDIDQCRSDLKDILRGWEYDLISDGNSESTGVGLTYYAPIKFNNTASVTDLIYNNGTGDVLIETDLDTQVKVGDQIKLADIRLSCGDYDNSFLISGFTYDNETGKGVVSLPFIHDIQVGDDIKLSDLKFDCPPYGAKNFRITDFVYSEDSGNSTVTLASKHDLQVGDTIELRDLQFDCPPYGGEFTDVTDLTYDNVAGTAIVNFENSVDLKAGDAVFLYDIQMTCPSYGNAISVLDFEYDNFTGQSQVTVAKPHTRQPGDLIKLENLQFSCQSYLNQTYKVSDFVYNNVSGDGLVTLNANHSFSTSEQVKLDGLVFTCDSYVPKGKHIVGFNYDNTTGEATIALDTAHNLTAGERFRLENISFACNSYSFTDVAVIDAPYDEVTGFVTLQLAQDHGQVVGQRVRLADLEYSCPNGSGITTTLFPDGTYGYEFKILDVPAADKMIVNVGTSVIPHSYVGGGTASVGITTTVFPDGTQGFDFFVDSVVNSTSIKANVGISTIAHTYAGGGEMYVGFTTTIFPDGTQGDLYTITSIPASNQLHIRVGPSTIAHTYVSGGTVGDTDSAISVSGFNYNEGDGTGVLTLGAAHGLALGETFLLQDLKFSCDSYKNASRLIDITNVQYDNLTGIAVIDVANSHNLVTDDTIALHDITFSCNSGGPGNAPGSLVYPDGSRPNFYDVTAVPTPNRIKVNVGTSTIPHTYTSGGQVQVGITTNIFPDGTRPSGEFFKVIEIPANNQIKTNIGVSSIAHDYVGGGKFYTGITTNIFPQKFVDPTVSVTNAVYDNVTGELTVTTDKAHTLSVNDEVLLQSLTFSCLSGGVGNVPGSLVFPRNNERYTVTSVVDGNNYIVNVGTNSIAHTYVSGGVSIPQNITNAVYNETTGELQVTVDKLHGYHKGDKASVVGLIFSCLSGGENNAPGELEFPRPNDVFTIVEVPNASTFTCNVGTSIGLPHTYTNGGSVQFGALTVQVSNATYDEASGELVVVTSAPLGAAAGAEIKMQGLNFSCASGGPGNDPGSIVFPRLDIPYFDVTKVVNGNTYTIQVGKSIGLPHTYERGGYTTLSKKANDPNLFEVVSVISPTKLVTKVGPSSIAHTYVQGGNLTVGITTNIFPDGTRPEGSRFTVISALSPNSALVNVGVSTIAHIYESGGRMQYGDTNERPVLDFQYSAITGVATVTVRGAHDLTKGSNVKLKDLEFSCTNSPGITTTIFPDGTNSSLNLFKVTNIINSSVFETNVGRVAFDHTYIGGGSAFAGITTNIFPDGTQGFNFKVTSVPNDQQVGLNVGISSIAHDYIRGGQLFAGRSNEREIFNFDYNYKSGDAVLTFRQPEENLFTGDLIKLKDLKFDCAESTGITTNIFPDGTQGNLFKITERINPTQFRLKIGEVAFDHTWVRGTGQAFVGITTNIFPDKSKIFRVVDIPTPNTVECQIGFSSIPHNYESGGKLSVGINTDIFPGNDVVSPLGDTFTVQSVTSDGLIGINVGVSSIAHTYAEGGKVMYGETAGGELQHITGPGVLEATVAAINFERSMSRNIINNRPWGSFIAAETAVIQDFQYDAVTGFATVIAPGINARRGDSVRLSDLQFRCSDEYAGLTTTFFPDNTRPGGQYFDVETRVNNDEFLTFVGVSSIAHRYTGGGNAYRYNQVIKDVSYENQTGLTSIRSLQHGFKVGDTVELADIRFDCNSSEFKPTYDIENFVYENTTGISTVTTTVDNDIKVGDLVQLADLKLKCDSYGNEKTVTGFEYDNKTGLSTVYTSTAHGITINSRPAVSITTAVYSNLSGILTVTTASDIDIDNTLEQGVRLTGLEFKCDSLGISSSLFYPEEDLVWQVRNIIADNKFDLKVGVSTLDHTYVGGGVARKVVKRSDIKLADLQFDCPAYGNDIDISNFLYDNTTGNSLITLDANHRLKVGDDIKLADIKFQCAPYGNNFSVLDAKYDNTIGILTITTNRNLGNIKIGTKVRVDDLQFDCIGYGNSIPFTNIFFDVGNRRATLSVDGDPGVDVGDNIKLIGMAYFTGPGTIDPDINYPDGRDSSLNIFEVKAKRPNQFFQNYVDLDVDFPNVDDPFTIFRQQGALITGITTNIYPDNVGKEGGFFDVLAINADNQFEVRAGISTIPHTWIRNGEVFSGVTTNFFPGNAQNSPKGDIYEVIDVPRPNQLRINVGVSSISHVYDEGGKVLTGITTNIFPDGTQGDFFKVVGLVSTTALRIFAGVSSIPHAYNSGGVMSVGITTNIFPGNKQNSPLGDIFKVLRKDDECRPDQFVINVGVSSINHEYDSGGNVTVGVTTNIFPGNSQNSPKGARYEVLSNSADYFNINVGVSSIAHTYLSGGSARRIEMPIKSFLYDGQTGLSTVGIQSHRLNIGDIVRVRDIKFDCDSYGNDKAISDVNYSNLTGILVVTTNDPHNLTINDTIKLSGIQMDCDAYGNERTIDDVNYNRNTGELTVTTVEDHGLGIADNVKLSGIGFTCPGGSGLTTSVFPDGTAPSINLYAVTATPNTKVFKCNVGISTIQHTYEPSIGIGKAFVGITTNIFPGSKQNSPLGSFLNIIDTPALNQLVVNVGPSSITHRYRRGGLVQLGITTDIFPDGTQGEFFVVEDVVGRDAVIINAGISSIVHRYNSGGFASKYATYQSKFPQVIDTSVIRVSGDCEAVGDRVDQLAGIVTSIIRNGPDRAPGGKTSSITNAVYNNLNGDLTITTEAALSLQKPNLVEVRGLTFECTKTLQVSGATYDNTTGVTRITTTKPHKYSVGAGFRLSGLEFSCPGGKLTYPSNPQKLFSVEKVIDANTFEFTQETSTKVHTYVGGGISQSESSQKIFPDNKVYLYPVKSVLSPTVFIINVGGSEIPHTYVTGGIVKQGLRYSVTDAKYDQVTGKLNVTTSEANYLVAGTGVNLNGLRFSCLSGGANNAPGELVYPDNTPANVTASTYDNVTGLLRVTTSKPHQMYRDGFVTLKGLEFSCPGGSLIYPSNPSKKLRVLGVEDDFTYQVQLAPSTKVHTYVKGGTSDPGNGNYRVERIISPTEFQIQMAANDLVHTYERGGTVASVFAQHVLEPINLRTDKCARDVRQIYLAVAHDITRGGNWKCSEAAKKYYDALGQVLHIAGGEIDQTVATLEYSLNVARCLINNVSWGGVPRGYLNKTQRQAVRLPKSTKTSVVDFKQPIELGQFTTDKKSITAFDYDRITGVATVTTSLSHGLEKYDAIQLADVKMRCKNSPRITTDTFPDGTQGETFEVIQSIQDNTQFEIANAVYTNTTGKMVITTKEDNNIPEGTMVKLDNLDFSCPSGGVPVTLIYPNNSKYEYKIEDRIDSKNLVIDAGISTIPHTFVGIETSFITEQPTKFKVHVGTVGFEHIYVSGGSVWQREPFQRPQEASQIRDVSIQDDPLQLTNSTPNACANVFSAIDNCIGIVTSIIKNGFEDSGVMVTYPGNDGKGVATMAEMPSQGVGNIIKGPYIRNCTNFVPKSIGMRMDGFDAEPGDEIPNGVQGSSNVDSFTQFNPGGIGCSISNGTYQQLVSIFTICCDEAIVCDSGAQLDLTNSNSSFGRLGLVARGIGDARSKCIDRYTGIVAKKALVDDDLVVIEGVGDKRPYDGQGIFFGELFREVVSIEVTDGGSGYDDRNPPNAFVAEPTGPFGIKAEVSPTVRNGEVVSIEVIANGNQYRARNPVVTIDPPKTADGSTAKARAITQPLYYDVDSSTEPVEGTTEIIFKQRLNNTVSVGTTVFFSRLSLQIASSHSFEYIGAGNSINGARPSQGGVPIKENEVVKEDGGSIVYTSTDQAGNFNIGDDLVINQFTGTITGRSFDQSVLNKVTPLIIALDS